MVKEDVENASGEGEQECGEGGCHEFSKMESGVGEIAVRVGVNPATPIYGDKPRSKLD